MASISNDPGGRRRILFVDPSGDRKAIRGGGFNGECCLVELSNRAAACVPYYRKKYGAPDTFADDHPSISRVVRSFCISFNDGIQNDETRTRLLRPYATKILGTATTALRHPWIEHRS